MRPWLKAYAGFASSGCTTASGWGGERRVPGKALMRGPSLSASPGTDSGRPTRWSCGPRAVAERGVDEHPAVRTPGLVAATEPAHHGVRDVGAGVDPLAQPAE